MKVIIDRFEGDFAVCECEDKTMINIAKNRIPHGVGEGFVLNIDGDAIILDERETKSRRNHIQKLMDDLWE